MARDTTFSHREIALLDVLRKAGGSARNSELALALDVSEETIRRAVKALSKSGEVARVHGGAYLVDLQGDPSYFKRIAQNKSEKRAIAEHVGRHIQDGMTLFLDVGTTTAFIAEELRAHKNLTVATNSIGVAQALTMHNGNRVFLIGGEMQSDERGAFGFVAEQQARRMSYDVALLSADALSAHHGFLHVNASEASLASVVIDCSQEAWMSLDHYKFGESAPHKGYAPSTMTRLFTNQTPDTELATQLATWNIQLMISNMEEAQNA